MLKKIVRYSIHKLRNPYSKIYFNSKVSLNSKLGRHSVVMTGTRIGECTIGDYTYVNVNCTFERTSIGMFCSIGPEVLCGLGSHPLDFISTYPGFYSIESSGAINFGQHFFYEDKKNVVIGNDVWIGARSIILGGVNIGHGAVIAAGSIVTKDVPPFAIVAGVPAKVIKFRFEPEVRIQILDSEWWNEPVEKLKGASYCANNPLKFISELKNLH